MPFLIVLGSGVLLLGLAYVIWIILTKRRHQGTPNWPKVSGQIAKATVNVFEWETPGGLERSYTPLIHYFYEVDGQTYFATERNVYPYYTATYRDPLKAERVITRYAEGSTVPIYYNPANPKQSVLSIPKPAMHNAVLYFGLANILAGAIILALGIVLVV